MTPVPFPGGDDAATAVDRPDPDRGPRLRGAARKVVAGLVLMALAYLLARRGETDADRTGRAGRIRSRSVSPSGASTPRHADEPGIEAGGETAGPTAESDEPTRDEEGETTDVASVTDRPDEEIVERAEADARETPPEPGEMDVDEEIVEEVVDPDVAEEAFDEDESEAGDETDAEDESP